MRILREIGIICLAALAIVAMITLAFPRYGVNYTCMLPNISNGERIVLDKLHYHFSGIERGEVIVFIPPPPNNPEEKFIKRVIGLPGETIEIKNGSVYIDNTLLEEEYLLEPIDYDMAPVTVPDNEYFVLGDNRNLSNDSHRWGTLPRENITGKAWLVYWPLNHLRLIQSAHY